MREASEITTIVHLFRLGANCSPSIGGLHTNWVSIPSPFKDSDYSLLTLRRGLFRIHTSPTGPALPPRSKLWLPLRER